MLIVLWTILCHCHNAHFIQEPLPEFRINLNAPSNEKFKAPNTYFKSHIQIRTAAILKKIPVFDQVMLYFFESVINFMHPNYYEEIKALSSIVEIPTYKLLAVDYINEELAACTSMCVKHPDGHIMHGRNLDTPWLSILRDTAYIAHFFQEDDYVYSAVIFAGFTGIYTGMRPGKFSLSIDLRRLNGDGPIFKNMLNILRGLKQDSWLLREVLTTARSYGEAVDIISTAYTAATDYFIVCGLNGNEGTVITKNRNMLVNSRELTNESWYIIQTNKDHFDGIYDLRYKAAITRLESVGNKNINAESLRNDVMLIVYPAQHDTVYTTTMIPAKNSFDAIKTTFTNIK